MFAKTENEIKKVMKFIYNLVSQSMEFGNV